jgi:hypothetical protein
VVIGALRTKRRLDVSFRPATFRVKTTPSRLPLPTRTWIAIGLGYIAATLLYAWPLLPVFATHLPSDTGDPGLNTWILWWNAHALPLTEAWWNAPIFFPIRGALALSEAFLVLVPLTTPLQWMGASPEAAYNAAFLLSFAAAGLAGHALGYTLTGRHGPAFIAGVAFGFSPYRAAQIPHLQTLLSCWMPVGLLALHRYLDRRRLQDLMLLAVAWLANGLSSGYFLFFFSTLVVCWMVWFVRAWRDAVAIAVTLALATLPLVPVLLGYAGHQSALGLSRSLGEIVFFSADVSAIWATSPFAWLAHHWTLTPRPEGELYPGIVVLALVVAGVIVAWRGTPRSAILQADTRARRRLRRVLWVLATLTAGLALASQLSGGWQVAAGGLAISTTHAYKTVTTAWWLGVAAALLHPRLVDAWRRRSTLAFYLVGALVMLVFALGPLGRAFGARFLYQAPYAWLMMLPGGHALRVPARFGTLVTLCLAEAAALAYSRLIGNRQRTLLTTCALLAVALDGWVPALKTEVVPQAIDLAQVDFSTPVLELPMRDLYSDTAAMLRATRHGHPLFNGYSGYEPIHYFALQEGAQTSDPTIFPALQSLGSFVVLIDRGKDDDRKADALVRLIPGVSLLRDTPIGPLYRVPLTASRASAPDRAIALRSIDAGGSALHSLFDDDARTTWPTDDSEKPETTLRVTLNRPAIVSAIELDLGDHTAAFPRHLRVESVDNAQTATIWDGSLAGAVLQATLTDPAHTPVVIIFDVHPHADHVLITLSGRDQDNPWRIADVRVFGHD